VQINNTFINNFIRMLSRKMENDEEAILHHIGPNVVSALVKKLCHVFTVGHWNMSNDLASDGERTVYV